MALDEKPMAAATEQHEDVGVDPQDVSEKHIAEANAAAHGQITTGYESLSVWQTVKTFKMASAICFLTALTAASDGYQISLIGNLIANPGFIQQFGTDRDPKGNVVLASTVLSLWASMGNAGQIVGMLTQSFVSGRFGRKICMYFLWTMLTAGCIIEVFSRDWKTWLVAKLFGGIAVGCMQTTLTTYISEIAPTRVRGAFLMLYSVWWMTGQFFGTLVLQIMTKQNPMDYLTPVYTQFAQVGIMIIIYLIIPESPAWLVSQGKTERAKKAMRFINRGVQGFDVDRQYTVTLAALEHEKSVAGLERSGNWYDIFKGTNGFRTIVSCWCLVTQMFIGLGLFFTYGTYFFQQAGLQDPIMIICITSGINILATIVIVLMSEWTGRRRLATYGTTICWVCNVFVGIIGLLKLTTATSGALIFFAVLWNVGLMANGSVGWGYVGEISTQRLRHYTAGFAAASSCLIGLAMNFLIPPMLNANEWNWGLKTGFFFAGIGAFFTLAMWFIIPETAGRSPAELDELFERKIRPWKFRHTETATQMLIAAEKTKGDA
ncbi:general substrate transporter [Plectosphaerella plurivora]|uniref:General substrate transporter n=1 Tax=Plectosphaerella plurivora TaxID=936078 RepID=A0A9P8VMQ2_9PEZI|nr:general substrate transporter [Plectosphaerella plurivora]